MSMCEVELWNHRIVNFILNLHIRIFSLKYLINRNYYIMPISYFYVLDMYIIIYTKIVRLGYFFLII